jgi:hypothetical protein
MSNLEWFKLWDETNHTFQWFIIKYFPVGWDLLEINRTKGNRFGMTNILNQIWFDLPDNQFNIMVNPSGWQQFLALIEE